MTIESFSKTGSQIQVFQDSTQAGKKKRKKTSLLDSMNANMINTELVILQPCIKNITRISPGSLGTIV